MKKLFGLFTSLMLSASAFAIDLKEGVHYEVIGKNATAQPEIKEYFSYYCPHCLSFEPLAKRLEQGAESKGYKFVKSHVDFVSRTGPDIQFMLAKALVTADKLNKPKASSAIFDYIHNKRGVFTSEQDIRNIFLLQGVDAKQFDKAFNSFAVKNEARKMKKEQTRLTQSGALNSVPTFIVNNKYKIIAQGFEARTYNELFDQLEEAAIQLSKK